MSHWGLSFWWDSTYFNHIKLAIIYLFFVRWSQTTVAWRWFVFCEFLKLRKKNYRQKISWNRRCYMPAAISFLYSSGQKKFKWHQQTLVPVIPRRNCCHSTTGTAISRRTHINNSIHFPAKAQQKPFPQWWIVKTSWFLLMMIYNYVSEHANPHLDLHAIMDTHKWRLLFHLIVVFVFVVLWSFRFSFDVYNWTTTTMTRTTILKHHQ